MSVIENLIKYYQWERATSFNGEVIIPSRRFAIECIIEQYSKMNNQSESDIGPVYTGIGEFYYALYGMASLLDIVAYEGKGVQK